MSDDLFQRAADLFLRARALDPPERQALLERECGGDATLRAGVEKLLRGAERPLALEQLAGDVLHLQEELSTRVREADVGQAVGPYKLLQKIGEGGFGTVYMAEQTSPVHRKVAIKILKPGMDTKQVIARFEAERQALALMEHENITRVLDAGATAIGRPYFVMELVRGIPITDYCHQNHLDTRQRIGLFLPVCHAIQHAHQKGVIHRDLKPSNVLVTLDDRAAVPKVIDFGIAKAIRQRLTDKTLFTEFRQFMGTPSYMSPEQAEMTGLDVDTRSDIYSLGVLLYELLTGTTPFDSDQLAAAPYGEVQRILREVEPPTPSRRLGTGSGGAAAELRDPAIQSRQLRGDLDWIVMKCLEKDRTRRYATANDLAADLERYLRDEPVSAGPPGTLYRLRKFGRRNRLLIAAGTAVLAALVLGLAAATYGLVQAKRGMDRAMAQMNKADTVLGLLRGMLGSANPREGHERDYTVRAMLDDFAARFPHELHGQGEVEAEVRLIVGGAYRSLAHFDLAGRQLEAARALADPGSTLQARCLEQLGLLQHDLGDDERAAQLLREALAIHRSHGRTAPAVATTLADLAQVALSRGALDEATRLSSEAIEVARAAGPEARSEVAKGLVGEAEVLRRRHEYVAAEPPLRQAVEIWREMGVDSHPDFASALDSLGALLRFAAKFDEAEKVIREGLAMRRKLFPDDHPDIAASLDNLGNLLGGEKRYADAVEIHTEALTMRCKLFGEDHPTVGQSLIHLAVTEQASGAAESAEQHLRRAVAVLRHYRAEWNSLLVFALRELGYSLVERHALAEARPVLEEGLELTREDPDHTSHAMMLGGLGSLALAEGKLEEAERLRREALALYRKAVGEKHMLVARELVALAHVLQAEHRLPEAEECARQSLGMYRELNDPDVTVARDALRSILDQEGKHDAIDDG